MKYDIKMIYFTLNGTGTKSRKVGTVTNGLENRFPELNNLLEPRSRCRCRGVSRFKRATWHNQRVTRLQRSRVEARVDGPLAGFWVIRGLWAGLG